MTRIIILALLLAAGGGSGSEILAQDVPRRDSAMHEALQRVRVRGDAQMALGVLVQSYGALSLTQISGMADSLVDIASAPADPERVDMAGLAAVIAIQGSATPDRGRAFSGAFERLVRIIREGSHPGTRVAAMSAAVQVGGAHRTVPVLRPIAASDDPLAWHAVELLARETGPEGLEALRRLYVNGAVTEPYAKSVLQGIAEYHGWGA